MLIFLLRSLQGNRQKTPFEVISWLTKLLGIWMLVTVPWIGNILMVSHVHTSLLFGQKLALKVPKNAAKVHFTRDYSKCLALFPNFSTPFCRPHDRLPLCKIRWPPIKCNMHKKPLFHISADKPFWQMIHSGWFGYGASFSVTWCKCMSHMSLSSEINLTFQIL